MGIRTIEDNFDYQAKEIIQEIVNDYKEGDDELNGVNIENWLWENREILGEYFYEKISEYMGMEEATEKIKW